MDQHTAKLQFELLDGLGQGGLRYVALFRRTGEIQRTRQGQEVSDLMEFHETPPLQQVPLAAAGRLVAVMARRPEFAWPETLHRTAFV
jgi:hypothetical protein